MMKIIKMAIAALAVCGAQAAGAAYPERAITLVVPFAAGGGTDVLARVVAERMTADLKTSVIVDNRPGASAQIGTRQVVDSSPDGYTLLVATNSLITGPFLFSNLPYDANRDLKPVVSMADLPIFLAVNSKHAAGSVQDFVKLAQKSNGQFNYGSAGPGTTLHMAAEWLKHNAKFEAEHIPFKGSGLAVSALGAGHVDFNMENLGAVHGMADSGRVHLLGVASPSRHPSRPDVPTLGESGLPDANLATWVFLMAPAGTPDAVVERLNASVNAILKDDSVREQLLQQGFVPTGGAAQDVHARMKQEAELWGNVIRLADITVQ